MNNKISGNDEFLSGEKKDWISTEYYNQADLLQQSRRTNLVFTGALMMYIIVSALVLFL